jgi:O-antigen/teichoic acid export membrane protein
MQLFGTRAGGIRGSVDSSSAKARWASGWWNGLDYVSGPLLWLAISPSLVQVLGLEPFGLLFLANTVVALGTLTAFGLPESLLKSLSARRLKHSPQEMVLVVQVSLFLASVPLVGVPCIAYLCAQLGPLVQIGPFSRALMVLMGIAVSVRVADLLVTAILHAHERFDLASKTSIPINLIYAMGTLLATNRGADVTTLFLFGVIAQAVGVIAKWSIAAWKVLPGLSLVPRVGRPIIVELVGFAKYSWAQTVAGLVVAQVDRLIVAAFLGISALAEYGLCLLVSQQVHALLARVGAYVFPYSSARWGVSDLREVRSVYFHSQRLLTALASGLGGSLLVISPGIVHLALGPIAGPKTVDVLCILSLAYMMMATSVVPTYYLNGTGHVRLNLAFAVLSAVLVLSGDLVLIPALGLIGAAVARLLMFPVSVFSRTFIHYRVLADPRVAAGLESLVSVLGCAALAWVAKTFLISGPWTWAGVILWSIGSFICLTLIAYALFQFPRRTGGESAVEGETELPH